MRTLDFTRMICALKHVNPRKEGNEEDGLELANDLKLVMEGRGDMLLASLGAERIAMGLYDKDDNFLVSGIAAIAFYLEFKDHDLKIETGSEQLELRHVVLKKFSIEFQDGPTAKMTFQAQVHPTSRQAAQLQECLGEEVFITVVPPHTLPGIAKAGKVDAKGRVCRICKKPITDAKLTVEFEFEGKRTEPVHNVCWQKEAEKLAENDE